MSLKNYSMTPKEYYHLIFRQSLNSLVTSINVISKEFLPCNQARSTMQRFSETFSRFQYFQFNMKSTRLFLYLWLSYALQYSRKNNFYLNFCGVFLVCIAYEVFFLFFHDIGCIRSEPGLSVRNNWLSGYPNKTDGGISWQIKH